MPQGALQMITRMSWVRKANIMNPRKSCIASSLKHAALRGAVAILLKNFKTVRRSPVF
jgi:hypothetical protein